MERLVQDERAAQPRLGGGKPLHILGSELEEAGAKMGRDTFFEVLREKSSLLDRLPGAPRTTNSRRSPPVFHNLVKDMALTAPNQARAADIAYIRADEGFLSPSLPMDMWPGKTVGRHAGDTLEAEGAVRALETALRELPPGSFPAHHSDRGRQYCSHRYVERLTVRGLSISVTEERRCYENARAERLNGILKREYGLGCSFRNKKRALAAVDVAVFLYNTKRPHLALNYETPEKRAVGSH